jgi:hypothetical protein
MGLNAVFHKALEPIGGGWLMNAFRRLPPGAVQEAAHNPGGWIYAAVGGFSYNKTPPPEALEGGWKVGDDGKIIGAFVRNPKFDASRWPT